MIKLTIIFNLRLHAPVDPSSYSLIPWVFSDPHSTPWLFIDPLDGPTGSWGSISTTLRTTAVEQWFLTFLRTRTPWAFIKFSRTPCLKASSNCYQRSSHGVTNSLVLRTPCFGSSYPQVVRVPPVKNHCRRGRDNVFQIQKTRTIFWNLVTILASSLIVTIRPKYFFKQRFCFIPERS